MNQDQFLGMLKIIVPAAVGWAVGKGLIPAGAAGDVGTAILTLAAAVWSYAAHSDSAKIAAVTALPDVKKIVTVQSPVNPAVAAAASDSSQTKVAPAP
jgi:hypothetical protein